MPSDFQIDAGTADSVLQKRAKVDAEIERLIGMKEIKKLFAKFRNMVAALERDRKNPIEIRNRGPMNLALLGSAGSGKTTVAKLIKDFMVAYGLVKNEGKTGFVETTGARLKGQYVGQSAPNVEDHLDRATNGVLFIDEAYSMCADDRDSFGKEAIS